MRCAMAEFLASKTNKKKNTRLEKTFNHFFRCYRIVLSVCLADNCILAQAVINLVVMLEPSSKQIKNT